MKSIYEIEFENKVVEIMEKKLSVVCDKHSANKFQIGMYIGDVYHVVRNRDTIEINQDIKPIIIYESSLEYLVKKIKKLFKKA